MTKLFEITEHLNLKFSLKLWFLYKIILDLKRKTKTNCIKTMTANHEITCDQQFYYDTDHELLFLWLLQPQFGGGGANSWYLVSKAEIN